MSVLLLGHTPRPPRQAPSAAPREVVGTQNMAPRLTRALQMGRGGAFVAQAASRIYYPSGCEHQDWPE
eukprot:scaffold169930_cov28-Tisochrysis_lutea.AAC.2